MHSWESISSVLEWNAAYWLIRTHPENHEISSYLQNKGNQSDKQCATIIRTDDWNYMKNTTKDVGSAREKFIPQGEQFVIKRWTEDMKKKTRESWKKKREGEASRQLDNNRRWSLGSVWIQKGSALRKREPNYKATNRSMKSRARYASVATQI